jgi:glc operon protein GlcG
VDAQRARTFFTPTKADTAMKTQSILESADVKAIAAAAEAEAVKNNWAVSIAIVDAGGHLLNFHRLDGAPPISAHIAPGKAHTAALGRRESKVYEDVINGGRTSFLSVPTVSALLEGGVPIMKDGHCLGAVGVSGVKSNEDAQIARAGIAAIGL